MTDDVKEAVEQARKKGQAAAEQKLPVHRSRWRQPSTWIALIGGLVIAGALIWLGVIATGAQNTASSLKGDVRHADDHASSNAAAASANASGLSEANNRIRSLGGTPVPTPTPLPGPTGQQGQPGANASDAQIETAVRLFCADHSNCTGVPSQAQVKAAVRAYCAAGACTGPKGGSGASGAVGAPGTQGPQGSQGDGPTTDQVQAAVAVYCASHGDCTGPAGPKGDTGDTGKTGRGIASIDCTGLGVDQLTITYDDGTSQTVPCDLAPPTPTETETP